MKKYLVLLALTTWHFITAQNYHDTQGKFDVTGGGQATYTLPIALPPSIQNVGPVINLSYASGQFGGIAGMGWSISSISTISRIATRKDIDGYIDGVDFDTNDRLALDGQRLLLKTGTYWANGSTYQTELQSNTKIELFGTGTGIYFIVTGPDGSRSWYGNFGTGGYDLTAYYITRFEDKKGNYFTYSYVRPFSKSLCIDEIKFSANTVSGITPQNVIKFSYEAAKRQENFYLNGTKQEKVELLDKIEVFTNGQLFRKYDLNHYEHPDSGYQKVSQIVEYNGALEASNPVVFDYTNTNWDIANSEFTKTYDNNISFEDTQLTGDFDGDGRLDFLSGHKLYTKLLQGSVGTAPISATMLSPYKKFTATTLGNGKLNQFQSIVNLQAPTLHQLSFKVYNLVNTTLTHSYTKTIDFENWASCFTSCDECYCDGPEYVKNTNEYLEGDFNGDGISEILILGYAEYKEYYEVTNPPAGSALPQCHTMDPDPEPDPGPPVGCYVDLTRSDYVTDCALLDLNPNSSVIMGTAGYTLLASASMLDGKKRYVMDFNGDGKSDILCIASDQSYTVVGFKQLTVSPWVQLELLGEGTIDEYSATKQILFGDYNGDSKADFMLPDTEGGLGDDLWHIYYSNPNPAGGSYFTKESHTIVEYVPDYSEVFPPRLASSSYYALDINNDGKSDLVRIYRRIKKDNPTDYDTEWNIIGYTNHIGKTSLPGNKFVLEYTSPCVPTGIGIGTDCMHFNTSDKLPTPVVSSYRYQGLNSEIIMIRDSSNKATYIDFKKDVAQDILITKITSSGGNIVDDIVYQTLEPTTPGTDYLGTLNQFYSSANSVNYPNVELKFLPTTSVVSKISNTAMGTTKSQDFRYHGYVANMDGLGMIGFRKTARSAWYQTATSKRIWSVFENNAAWRGALQRSYTQLVTTGNAFTFVNSGNPAGIINSTTNVFSINVNSGVCSILLNLQTTEDFLSNIKNEKAHTYLSPYNLQGTLISRNYAAAVLQGTETTTNEYDNNPAGSGSSYYIGRPKRVTQLQSAYSNTFSTEEKYTYTGVMLTKTEKKADNTDGVYLTEVFEYFPNGNLKKKTLTAPGAVPAVSARVTEYTYDTSERFVKTFKNIEGQITTFNTYHPLYGVVLTETSPLGLATTTGYDNWGKKSIVTDYLGKSINYTYTKSGTLYTALTTSDDGSSTKTESDALGRVTRQGATDINANWSYKDIEYDFLNRKKKESESYAGGGSASQWTTITYDDYSRIIATASYTGQNGTVSYSGLTVTSFDGTKTTTSTKNSNGHVTSTTDPGGTITNAYYANGNLKTSTYDAAVIAMEYDGWGRKTKITDPSAGIFQYQYNAYGEITKEITPKGTITYTLSPTGKISYKSTQGDFTSFDVGYSYHPVSKMLTAVDGIDNATGDAYVLEYFYDAQYRLITQTESNTQAYFEKKYEYDAFGRTSREYYKAMDVASGNDSSKWIRHEYKNGHPYKIIDDATGTVLREINSVNARGQVTAATYAGGAGEELHTYDSYGFPLLTTFRNVSGPGASPTPFQSFATDFDAAKGTLKNRTYSMLGFTEYFHYDTLDRLVDYTNGSNVVEYQSYDAKGRINQNVAGTYSYDISGKPYQTSKIALTPAALAHYTNRPVQTVTYNVFKSPVNITEQGKELIDFEYNALETRATMYYGGTQADKTLRPYRKFYSADGVMEIRRNTSGGALQFITFIGGDGYTAPVMLKKQGVSQSYYYLQRDYLGSILSVTLTNGRVAEKRHFDAWGKIVFIKDGNSFPLAAPMALDRGYTGHEHLIGVGLIHMNGRLYDPYVHRFLQPDNFIQDPSNTQNFNRYSYVLNNPLKYTDPNGEEFTIVTAIVLGAAISALTYTIDAIINNGPITLTGILKCAAIGAFSGAVTFGIGSAVSPISNFALKATVQALAHGIFQGAMSGIQGGDFWQGFAAGSISSAAASLYGGVGADNAGWHGLAGCAGSSDIGMIIFGTVSGGAGALLTKGNFWQGAITGLVVSGLNHAMHDSGESEVEQTKTTTETSITDEKPFVLNESRKTIHYKPESTSEALPLRPGEKTYDPVDGINVRGKVYKVSDGYTSVTVKANFNVVMDYSKSGIIQTYYALFKGGHVTRSDFKKGDTGWDNLFKIKQ